MPRFFFPVDYDGLYYDDHRGEDFTTPAEAESHAEIIAQELSRNHSKSVTVYVVNEDRSLTIEATSGRRSAK
jgi:hypothetical protein